MFDGITGAIGKAWDNMGKAWSLGWDGADKVFPAAYDIGAGGLGTDGDRVSKGFSQFFAGLRDYGNAFTTALSTVVQPDEENYVPVVHETQWTLSKLLWLYDRTITYGIRRPITTILRTGALADMKATDPNTGEYDFWAAAGNAFDGATWRQAWNDSEFVTPGQQAMHNMAMFATGEGAMYDPRTEEGRKHYYEDPLFQGISGSLDFGLMFVDPLKLGGSLGKAGLKTAAAKGLPGAEAAVRKVNNSTLLPGEIVPNQAMRDAGFLERDAFGGQAQHGDNLLTAGGILSDQYKLIKDTALKTDVSTFQRLMFNDQVYGGVTASVLHTLAHGGDDVLFADGVLAARGSVEAMERLQVKAPEVALQFARHRQGFSIPSLVRTYATDPQSALKVNAMAATHFQSWINEFGKDIEGQSGFWAAFQGSQFDRGAIRANIMDKMRVGLHQKTTAWAPTVIGRWTKGVSRGLNPSARYVGHVDVNSAASFRDFRANIERSPLDLQARNELAARYMNAATPQERSHIIEMAEERIIEDTIAPFGISMAEYRQYSSEISDLRKIVSQALQGSKRHIPKEILSQANKMLRAGRAADAQRLKAVAKEYQELVKEGKVPEIMNLLPDERAQMQLISGGQTVGAGKPFFESTTANLMPMLDYRELEVGLRRSLAPMRRLEMRANGMTVGGSKLADVVNLNAYKTTQRIGAILDMGQGLWSMAAILRPAQLIRSGAGDLMQAVAHHGVMPYLWAGSVGATRLAYRTARGALGKAGATNAQARLASTVARLSKGRIADIPISLPLHDYDLPSGLAVPDDGVYPLAPLGQDLPGVKRSVAGSLLGYGGKPLVPKGSGLTGNALKMAKFQSLESAVAYGVLPGNLYVDYALHAVANGQAPMGLVAIVDKFQNSTARTAVTDLHHEVYAYMLTQAGYGAFLTPTWQRDLYDAAKLSKHGVVVNALNGQAQPKALAAKVFDTHDAGPTAVIKVDPKTGAYNIDEIYEFLIGNALKMVQGGFDLHMVKVGQGDMRATLVRPRNAQRTVAERMTTRQREQILNGLKSVGTDGVTLDVGGLKVDVPGLFEGMEGAYTQANIGARTIRGMAWGETVSTRAAERMIIKGNQLVDHSPGDRGYEAAYEYYVNSVVANDAAARLTLEGKSFSDILNWLSTKEGRAWVKTRPYKDANLPGQVKAIMDATNRLATDNPDLRAKILQHSATHKDLAAVVLNPKDRPMVQGQADAFAFGNHPVMEWAGRQVEKTFGWLQDLPLDKMIRHPFAAVEYRRVAEPMLRNYMEWAGRNGKAIDPVEVSRITTLARQHTLDRVRQTLYDTASRADVAHAMRLFMPFSNAVADATFKWMKTGWNRPVSTIGLWTKFYNAPERAGLVYDQDGYHLEYDGNGNEVWTHPVSGERAPADARHDKFVLMRFPDMGGRQSIQAVAPGAKNLQGFSKGSMNPILAWPTAGPLVALPVNAFVLKHPKFADNPIVKQFILPFGPTDEGAFKQALPGLMNSWDKWANDNQDLAGSAAMRVYAAWLTEWAAGERQDPPSYEEAKKQAESEVGLRFLVSAFSPVSLQTYNPYKPYMDYYKTLIGKHGGDETLAMEEFRKEAGDEFRFLTYHISKANVSVPATRKGYDMFNANRDKIEKFPELAGLITGRDGAGEWSKAVYEWQKTITIDGKPLRQEMTAAESVEEVESRIVWDEYTKLMGLIKAKLNEKGKRTLAEDANLSAARNAWIDSKKMNPDGTVSAWYRDFMSTDAAAMDARLIAMRELVSDPKFVEGRQDLQGLQIYLRERDRFRDMMAERNYKTLTSQRSAWLRERWDTFVSDLTDRNLAFESLYHRWLSRDELNDAGVASDADDNFSFEGVMGSGRTFRQ